MSYEIQVTPWQSLQLSRRVWRGPCKGQQNSWVSVRPSHPVPAMHPWVLRRSHGSPESNVGENRFPWGLCQPGLEKRLPKGWWWDQIQPNLRPPNSLVASQSKAYLLGSSWLISNSAVGHGCIPISGRAVCLQGQSSGSWEDWGTCMTTACGSVHETVALHELGPPALPPGPPWQSLPHATGEGAGCAAAHLCTTHHLFSCPG